MRKTHEAFPRSRTSYFRFACFFFFFFFATILLSASLAEAGEKYIESVRQSAICFFCLHAIARNFFFLGFEIMEEFFWIWPFKTTTKKLL